MKSKTYSGQKTDSGKSSTKVMTLILACFFFSGMTGLIYEILWTRMIVKIIGAAPLAVTIILTIFMAGLGLGSYIASKKIDKIKHQLKLVRIYGVLEIAIGAYCLVLPLMLKAFEPFYALMYNRLFEHFMLYNLLTFLGCAILLIIPAICMGATLPILCRFYVTKLSHLAGHAGRLYGLNTIGAAFGSVLCGFWLIANLGMTGTLVFAVLANAVIGLICIVASYKMTAPVVAKLSQKDKTSSPDTDSTKGFNAEAIAALIIFAISGFCAMAYEVIWTKLLGLIIGPTTYSFTIVLVTFITCLALGSMLFGWLGDRVKKPIWLLLYTQIAAAFFALLISQLLGNSQFFFAKLIYHNQGSFAALNLLKALSLFIFMLPPTICLGATFPLVGKICTQSLQKVGRTIGFAYAINTIGAVLGSFCAGFILVPFIGKENGLRLVFAIQILTAITVACWILIIEKKKGLNWATIVIAVLMGLLLAQHFPNWNRKALSMGRYHRLKEMGPSFERTGWIKALVGGAKIMARQKTGKIVYYGDGIAGFTTVLVNIDKMANVNYALLISGKADASTDGDMPTQTLLAHVPMLFHHNPKSIMVLGYASGITAGEILNYPVKNVDVLEISREVVKASEFFEPWNGNVLANPKTNLIIQDGRAHLQLTDRKYDVIVSEPSNPWMAGLATLFTENYFQLAKDRLNRDGIFAQFLHSYQMDWNGFSMVCRTFASVFPNNAMVRTAIGDFMMVGFNGKKGFDIKTAYKNMKYAKKSDNIIIRNPKVICSLITSEDLEYLAGPGKINSDEWPHLEFQAPKAMYDKSTEKIRKQMHPKRTLHPATMKIVKEYAEDVDAQIDLTELALSVYVPFEGIVNLDIATPLQKKKYYELVLSYAAKREMKYAYISNTELKAKCYDVQIDAIKKRIDKGINKAIAYSALTGLYARKKQYNQTEKYSRMALEFLPNSANLYRDLAFALHLQDKLNDAIIYYNKALELNPDLVEARKNRDLILEKLSHTEKKKKQ